MDILLPDHSGAVFVPKSGIPMVDIGFVGLPTATASPNPGTPIKDGDPDYATKLRRYFGKRSCVYQTNDHTGLIGQVIPNGEIADTWREYTDFNVRISTSEILTIPGDVVVIPYRQIREEAIFISRTWDCIQCIFHDPGLGVITSMHWSIVNGLGWNSPHFAGPVLARTRKSLGQDDVRVTIGPFMSGAGCWDYEFQTTDIPKFQHLSKQHHPRVNLDGLFRCQGKTTNINLREWFNRALMTEGIRPDHIDWSCALCTGCDQRLYSNRRTRKRIAELERQSSLMDAEADELAHHQRHLKERWGNLSVIHLRLTS